MLVMVSQKRYTYRTRVQINGTLEGKKEKKGRVLRISKSFKSGSNIKAEMNLLL